MFRSCVTMLLLLVALVEVSEARNRGRVYRYQTNAYPTNAYQTSTPRTYTNWTGQSMTTHSTVNGTQQIQPISFQNNSFQTPSSSQNSGSMQAWAEEEARLMASRGTCGHVRSAPMGHFVGVGCGTTCVGSGQLVAEAHYQGRMVLVWRM